MNRVFLSIGSNIHREYNLPASVRLLREKVLVIAVSSVYESTPIGSAAQPNFFNAAVLIETDLSPEEIKDQLITDIEKTLKRERQEDKNAPRTIDIDIALFNDEILDYIPADGRPRHLPDPDLLQMAHSIVPIAELAPNQVHPEMNEPLGAIATRLLESSRKARVWLREDIGLSL